MPSQQPAPAARRLRWLWWLLAWVSLGLGVIGMFVPGLPTVPFVLLSAWAAARGSERLYRRLLRHPRFGPMITAWQVYGTVSRKAKWAATTAMVASTLFLLVLPPLSAIHRWWMTALPVACMTAVAIWLWRQPEPPPTRHPAEHQ